MRKGAYRLLFCLAAALALPLGGCAWMKARGIETEAVGALGGGYPDRVGGQLAGRVRYLSGLNLGLEGSVYVPYGVGANLLFDVWRSERLRVHVIDPGVFYAWTPGLRVVRPDIKRSFDLTLGLGAEWRFRDRWSLTGDLRFFFPDPIEVVPTYGEFAREAYLDALLGGQLWLGAAYAW